MKYEVQSINLTPIFINILIDEKIFPQIIFHYNNILYRNNAFYNVMPEVFQEFSFISSKILIELKNIYLKKIDDLADDSNKYSALLNTNLKNDEEYKQKEKELKNEQKKIKKEYTQEISSLRKKINELNYKLINSELEIEESNKIKNQLNNKINDCLLENKNLKDEILTYEKKNNDFEKHKKTLEDNIKTIIQSNENMVKSNQFILLEFFETRNNYRTIYNKYLELKNLLDNLSQKDMSNASMHFQRIRNSLKNNGFLNSSILEDFDNHEKYISSLNEQLKIYKYNYNEEINKVKKLEKELE